MQGIVLGAREDDHQLQGVPSGIAIEECEQNNAFSCKQKKKRVPSIKKNLEDISKKERKSSKKETKNYKAKC